MEENSQDTKRRLVNDLPKDPIQLINAAESQTPSSGIDQLGVLLAINPHAEEEKASVNHDDKAAAMVQHQPAQEEQHSEESAIDEDEFKELK